jgi:hypothetical protein
MGITYGNLYPQIIKVFLEELCYAYVLLVQLGILTPFVAQAATSIIFLKDG